MTVEVNAWVNLPALVTIMRRHRFQEGFCVCDGQPWPCDVRLIQGSLIKELEDGDVVPPV